MADENKMSTSNSDVMQNGNTIEVGPDTLRENLIATAVRFLQNPKVVQSPLNQKRSFLEKKGLTSKEIDVAFARAGVTDVVQSTVGIQPVKAGQYNPGVQGLVSQTAPVSAWTKFKDYTSSAVIVGGIVYLVYKIYKQYILPFWFGPNHEEQQLEAIRKSVNELQSSIADTLKYIREMQNSISTQQIRLEELSSKSPVLKKNSSEETLFIKEVKDEIKSLKGLLLSRKQFPPTPPTQPVLPAWQLTSPAADETVVKDVTGSKVKALEVTETAQQNNDTSSVNTNDTSTMSKGDTSATMKSSTNIVDKGDTSAVASDDTSLQNRDDMNALRKENQNTIPVTNGCLPNGNGEKDKENTDKDQNLLNHVEETLDHESMNQTNDTAQNIEVSS